MKQSAIKRIGAWYIKKKMQAINIAYNICAIDYDEYCWQMAQFKD